MKCMTSQQVLVLLHEPAEFGMHRQGDGIEASRVSLGRPQENDVDRISMSHEIMTSAFLAKKFTANKTRARTSQEQGRNIA